jgi:hypothetical protein
MKSYLILFLIATVLLVAQRERPRDPAALSSTYSTAGGRSGGSGFTRVGLAGGGGGGGGGANPGTANQIAYYATTGSTVSGDANFTDSGTALSYLGSQVCTASNAACPSGLLMVSTEGSVGGAQGIAVGTANLSGGTLAVTIPATVYNSGYQWAATATSFTANPVYAAAAVSNVVTFHGTGTDAFSFIIFPIFQLSRGPRPERPGTGAAAVILARLTSSSRSSDVVTMEGVTAEAHCSLTATNSRAASNIASAYIRKSANEVTVSHARIAGMTYDIMCTPD